MEIKFLSIGPRVKVKINQNEDAVVNQWYGITTNFRVEKFNNSDLGEPLDSIRYVARNNDKQSNEATIEVNFPPDKTSAPNSINKIIEIDQNDVYSLKDLLTLNDSSDRIRITSYVSNVGSLLFNNSQIYPGMEFMIYDLANLKFHSESGTGSPYQNILFQVGTKERWSQVYRLQLNIIGISQLDDPIVVNPSSYEYRTASATFKIKNAVVNGKVRYEVTYSSDSNEISIPENEGSIVISETDIARPGTYSFESDLNNQGEFDVKVNISSKNVITDSGFNFTVKVISVNGDENLVGDPDEKSVTLNL